jgi:hypothetical protein
MGFSFGLFESVPGEQGGEAQEHRQNDLQGHCLDGYLHGQSAELDEHGAHNDDYQ